MMTMTMTSIQPAKPDQEQTLLDMVTQRGHIQEAEAMGGGAREVFQHLVTTGALERSTRTLLGYHCGAATVAVLIPRR